MQKSIERIEGQPADHIIKKESLFTDPKSPGKSMFPNQFSPQTPSGSSASMFGQQNKGYEPGISMFGQQAKSSKSMFGQEKAKSMFPETKNSSAQKSLFKMQPSNLKGGEAHGIAGRTMFGGHIIEGKRINFRKRQ